MSEKMTPIPFGELMNWILAEREQSGSVFGVEHIYHAPRDKKLPLFGEFIETPFGPAAGPHTQLAQNIIAAYYAGARFFELKTVQIMDGEELSKCVPRPCILAQDEGYNCEWSTELKVEQALEEYIKAWFACKLLAREYALGDENGFVFNMSVGYDYAGITTPKIDNFIEGMRNAEDLPVFQECKAWALQNLRLFERVNAKYIEGISAKVCSSITLSTLHGCPPEEIEKIASYLINTKKMHTFVKCNPTILGYESARTILDSMGYDYIAFDEHHFNEDLQYKDALQMFVRLLKLAKEHGVEFGLKLSNTFPVDVTRKELPSEEMYMSGRSLYPLTIEMANRFTHAFDGRMRLSFSGGADAFNLKGLFQAGIWPVTVATTLLKPGGYDRLQQLARQFETEPYGKFEGVSVAKVEQLAQMSLQDPHHKKPVKERPGKKIGQPLPLLDCFTAPCKSGCPIGQDVPEYVNLVGQGKDLQALRVITEKNPLPFITGRICNHRCMDKCVRGFYEEPIRIRNAKLEAVRGGYEALIGEMETPVMTSSKRVAIIGGGPAGLAAAYFLGRAGVPVTLYEKREQLGGIVRYVIPEFRISHHGIDRDVQLVEKMGVRFKLGAPAPSAAELKEKGYDYILYAVGAWKPGQLKLEQGDAMNVLEFLEKCKDGSIGSVGKSVCIVGGGNTAMDAARAAKRLPGVEKVQIVYRRTKKFMPADEEELDFCKREGVEFCETLSPVSLCSKGLTCGITRMGAPDESGRCAPVDTGETTIRDCDFLVAAVGEKVEEALFRANGIEVDSRGRVMCDPDTLQTSVDGVFVLGDARRGPATVVEAIADAQKAADHILQQVREYQPPLTAYAGVQECKEKWGELEEYKNASRESERCLFCSVCCELCTQVCPNRANVALSIPGCESEQILHVDRMCNECGNCAVFCPYDGAPYLDKPTLYHTEAGFNDSKNEGFLHLGEKKFRVRYAEQTHDIDLEREETGLPAALEAMLLALTEEYAYLLA